MLKMTPRQTLFLVFPIIVVLVLLLTYLQVFSSTIVIAVLVVLYFVVSIRNKRKFSKQKAGPN